MLLLISKNLDDRSTSPRLTIALQSCTLSPPILKLCPQAFAVGMDTIVDTVDGRVRGCSRESLHAGTTCTQSKWAGADRRLENDNMIDVSQCDPHLLKWSSKSFGLNPATRREQGPETVADASSMRRYQGDGGLRCVRQTRRYPRCGV